MRPTPDLRAISLRKGWVARGRRDAMLRLRPHRPAVPPVHRAKLAQPPVVVPTTTFSPVFSHCPNSRTPGGAANSEQSFITEGRNQHGITPPARLHASFPQAV